MLIALAGAAALLAAAIPGLGFALGAVCHQDSARSIAGLALCARCLGLYAGLLLAAAVPVRFGPRPALAVIALSLAAWFIDANAVRLALGLALGWTGGCYLITLGSCPTTARAERSFPPTPGSVTSAASRNATSR